MKPLAKTIINHLWQEANFVKNKPHRKHKKSYKRSLKRMAAAAAVAGVALVSSTLMPGTVHAAASPDAAPTTADVHTVKTAKGIFNMQSDAKIPMKKLLRDQAKVAALQRNRQTANQSKAEVQQLNYQVSQQVSVDTAANKQADKTVQASPVAAKIPANSTKVLDVTATAYAPGPHDNGKWGDKTHIGTTVRPGIIAVDPNIMPLGSEVYIEYPDGTGQYAVAEDTGGAIKGNRIDVAMESVRQAYDFGIKKVKVHVLGQKA